MAGALWSWCWEPPCSVSGADGYHPPTAPPAAGSGTCTVGIWNMAFAPGLLGDYRWQAAQWGPGQGDQVKVGFLA